MHVAGRGGNEGSAAVAAAFSASAGKDAFAVAFAASSAGGALSISCGSLNDVLM